MTSLYWMTPSLFCHFLSPFLTTSSPSPFPVDVIFELPHTVAIITSFERFSWVTKLFSKVQINVSVKNVFFVRVCVCMRACMRARARACVCARTWNTKLVSFTNWFSKYSKCHKFVFFLFQEDFYAPPQWVSYLFLSFIPSASLKLCKILIGFVNIYL